MRRASIVSIGNEILTGQTVDTNAAYLCEKLFSIGIPVVSSYTVSDEIERIVRALNSASDDAEIVLATGGLGPTDDDLTRQGFARFLGSELKLQDELLQKIQRFFGRRNLQMSEKNKVQAYLPAGTEAVANELGTAPGIMAEMGEKFIFAMPGVPLEMKTMFEESVLPKLKNLAAGQVIVARKLRCFGAGESNIAEMLGNLMDRERNPLINCTASSGIITLHIVATTEDKAKAQKMVEKEEKMLRERLGDLVYGTGEQTLAEVVGRKLAQEKKTIATAESCTGGILAKLLTDIPGASEYFTHGWVTYSNAAKINELGVQVGLIDKYGAVSEQAACAMACGARKKAGTDFAIGITGIAGPTGATEHKPIGLVYICVESDSASETRRFVFPQDRYSIRLRATKTALNMIRLKL
ncbi:MAG: competence/damage-inducible protein A [Planctomycetota bacterium]|jgi:nicotinamide-nucleotide amidase